MYNKKLCGHDFDEDCNCVSEGLASFEVYRLMIKTSELYSESRKIFNIISTPGIQKRVEEDYRYVIYIYTYTDIVLRGCRSFKSSCVRSDIGLIGAAGAARTLFEIGINTRYIMLNKGVHLQQFLANAAGTFEKGANLYWKFREKENMEIPELYIKCKEDLKTFKKIYGVPRAANQWSGRGVGGRANDVGMKGVYDFIYPVLSSITHASSIQMSAYTETMGNITGDNLVKLHSSPDTFSNIFFLHSAWMVVLWSIDLMMSEFMKVFEIPYRDTMDFRRIRSFTKEVVNEFFELCELCSEE